MTIMPHNHRMWAVIGVYTGREDNIFWRRIDGGRVEAAGAKALSVKDAAPLGPDIIHSVTNPIPRLTGAIHVYGGDFFAMQRSEWDPETLVEGRYDPAKTIRMFEEFNRRAVAACDARRPHPYLGYPSRIPLARRQAAHRASLRAGSRGEFLRRGSQKPSETDDHARPQSPLSPVAPPVHQRRSRHRRRRGHKPFPRTGDRAGPRALYAAAAALCRRPTEPVISAHTISFHYGHHHVGYVDLLTPHGAGRPARRAVARRPRQDHERQSEPRRRFQQRGTGVEPHLLLEQPEGGGGGEPTAAAQGGDRRGPRRLRQVQGRFRRRRPGSSAAAGAGWSGTRRAGGPEPARQMPRPRWRAAVGSRRPHHRRVGARLLPRLPEPPADYHGRRDRQAAQLGFRHRAVRQGEEGASRAGRAGPRFFPIPSRRRPSGRRSRRRSVLSMPAAARSCSRRTAPFR